MLRVLERLLLVTGIFALSLFTAGYVAPRVQATEALDSFEQSTQLRISAPDMAQWSPERILAYDKSVANQAVVGVLRIDSVSIRAPIFVGASDAVLDRGVGWIEGTSTPGHAGNVGLAAHRDGYFRGLKDIQIDDEVRMQTRSGERVYRVSGTDIIAPDETYVLAPTARAALTLVTCHPFYFVGSAPNRFVVYAIEDDA